MDIHGRKWLNMCLGSHHYGSFEYPQHKFSLSNKKIYFSLCTLK